MGEKLKPTEGEQQDNIGADQRNPAFLEAIRDSVGYNRYIRQQEAKMAQLRERQEKDRK